MSAMKAGFEHIHLSIKITEMMLDQFEMSVQAPSWQHCMGNWDASLVCWIMLLIFCFIFCGTVLLELSVPKP